MNPEWTGERLETFVYTETTIEHLHRYAFASNLIKGKIVLDVACGEGYGSNLLAARAKEVIGIDIDEQTISKAIAKYRKSNLKFIKDSATQLPFAENVFDVAVCFETIEHIEQHDQMLREIKRVLKPTGLLIISTPDKKSYSDETGYINKYHLKELYKEDFAELIQKHFRNYRMLQQSFIHGSLLLETIPSTFQGYSGDFTRIDRQAVKPLYWVIVASDNDLNSVESSIFFDKNFLSRILQIEIEKVKNTYTYRLGHLLLKPFKWIASVFRS